MVTAVRCGENSEGENPTSGRDMKEGRESQREANPWGAEKVREGKVLSEVNSGTAVLAGGCRWTGKKAYERREAALSSKGIEPNRKLDGDRWRRAKSCMVIETSVTMTRDMMEDLKTEDLKINGAQGAANQ